MSSLFNKTTGLSLASVLGNSVATTNVYNNTTTTNTTTTTGANLNSSKLLPKSVKTCAQPLLAKTSTSTPVKQFSEQLKLQQHQHALNANSFLKTIDSCLEEASRTGDLQLTNKSLIEFPSTIAFKYDLTDTLTVGESSSSFIFDQIMLKCKNLKKSAY